MNGAKTATQWLFDHATGVYGLGDGYAAAGSNGEFVVLRELRGWVGLISVGVYRDEDAFRANDALRLRKWATDSAEATAEAVEMLRYWCGAENTAAVAS